MSVHSPATINVPFLPMTVGQRWFAVFVRMVWKELRVVCPFLLVVAGTMLGLGVMVHWAFRDSLSEALGTLYALVVAFPFLFSLGCGGMAYAGEREDGTWDWLRRIAAPPSAVCVAKIVVGVVCSGLLSLVAWFALMWYARGLSDRVHEFGIRQTTIFLIGVSITLLLSQIVSSLIKNVFAALIASGVLLAPVLTVMLALVTDHTGSVTKATLDDGQFLGVIFVGVLVLIAMTICELSLADCWLKDVPPWRGGLLGWLFISSERRRQLHVTYGYRRSSSTHLMSREWSMVRPWLWSFTLMLVIPLWFAIQYRQMSRQFNVYRAPTVTDAVMTYVGSPLASLATMMLALLPALLGVWAYQPDQRDLRFRFLADRGISPTAIWLSKHAVRLPLLLAMLLCMPLVIGVGIPIMTIHRPPDDFFPTMWWIAGNLVSFALMTYSVGQLLGQLIRSPITSSFLAAVSALLLAGWIHCLRWLHLPFVFDVATIAIPFAASWLRSRDWLLERTTWRARLQLAASVLLPFAMLYGSVGLYRFGSLPRVNRALPTVAEMREYEVRSKEQFRQRQEYNTELDSIYRRELANLAAELKPIRERWLPWSDHSAGMRLEMPGSGIGLPTPNQKPIEPADIDAFVTLFPGTSRDEAQRLIHSFANALDEELSDSGLPRHHEKLLGDRFAFTSPRAKFLAKRPDHFERLLADLHLKHFQKTRTLFVDRRRGERVGFRNYGIIPVLMQGLAEWSAERGDFASAADIEAALGSQDLYPDRVERLLHFAAGCRDAAPVKRLIREWSSAKHGTRDEIEFLWWITALANDPEHDARLIAGLETRERSMLRRQFPMAPFLMRVFPWELPMARREWNRHQFREIAVLEAIDDVMHDRGKDLILWHPHPQGLMYVKGSLERHLPLVPEFDEPIQFVGLLGDLPDEAHQRQVAAPETRGHAIAREVERRQVVTLLALIAWRIEHGEFPDRLDELVGGSLDELPRDPLCGEPFAYAKSPHPTLIPPSIAKGKDAVPQLRVRSLDGQRNVWLEIAPQIAVFELPKFAE